MTTEPEQLRREIERTQRGLSADVDALTEKVTPSRIVHRRVDRTRRALTSVKDTIMGTASEATDRIGSTASSVSDNISSAGQAVSDAPQRVRRQTQGNPFAAGLIAFGLGWLAASLVPASRREQEIAEQAKEMAKEHVQPAVTEMAGEVKDNLREPAEQAVESIKSTAQDAGSAVADETRSAAKEIKDRAQESTGTTRN